MAFRIPLKPLSGTKKKPQPFSVIDMEGANWTKFLAAGWCNGEYYEAFDNLGDLIDFIFDETSESVVFAHFGGIYDHLFVIKEVIEQRNCRIENLIPRGSGLLCFDVIREKRVKNHATGGFSVRERKITFRDSSAILPFSLKKITHSFDVKHKKLDFDVENLTKMTPDAWKYLEHDCWGLWEAIHEYYNWDLIRRVGPATTMASQALKVFRLFMHSEIKSLKESVDEFVRQAYFGGRTEIFRPEYNGRKKKKPIKCYDVNSLYPTVMRNNEFPTNFRYFTYTYKPEELGFYEAEIEVPKNMYLPPLPVQAYVTKDGFAMSKQAVEKGLDGVEEFTEELKKATEKLIFPTGRLKGVWSTIEIEYARSLGCKIIKTGKGAIFQNGGHIFREFIDTLYKKRLEAKAKGDGVGDILTKLLMNSCYGRFGLNTDREQLVFDDFSEGLKFHSEIPIKTRKGNLKVRLMTKDVKLDKTFTNVAIAAWVTSLARIHMHKLMWPVRDKIYYTDTDSIYTTEDMETGEGLGELKYEGLQNPETGEEEPIYEAVFLLPKTYVVQGRDDFRKVAMKGFDKKKIKHFKYEDFFTALEGDLRHMRVVHDPKMAKFKTAAKKGDLTTLLPGHERQIRSYYDKRRVFRRGKSWNTKPLQLKL